MSKSRTKNVTVNMIVGLICQGIGTIMGIVSRTVFIRTLGSDYLGVNGLFTNVLSILSFAELGIGDAIGYSLYKPIATGDKEKIGSLMDMYKKCYRFIGVFIAAAGLGITPFLGYIIKTKPDIPENLVTLYWLFLTNTAVSYFFVYKRSIINANQKNYIVVLIEQIVSIANVVLQVIFLYLTHNYIVYLLIQISTTIIGNIATMTAANRMYPYLKKKAVPLASEERKGIFKNVGALAMYKIGLGVLSSTDNILVSVLVGIREVGLVSNYVLLYTSCKSILVKITSAFWASVGNLNATADDDKKYSVFNKILLITSWLYGFVSVGLITVSGSLIKVWLGDEYLLSQFIVVAIISEFYFNGMKYATTMYRGTCGYFVQGKFAAIWSAVLNIALSVLLCKWIGLPGIFIATSIARFLGIDFVDAYLVYTKAFHKTPVIFWAKYFGYVLLTAVIGIICNVAVTHIIIGGWFGVIVQILAVTVIFNGIMLLIFGRTKIFAELIEYFMGLLRRRKRAI